MAKKSASPRKTSSRKPQRPAWQNLLLSLSLVPLVAGIFFIVAWALDWDITGALESQIWVGVLLLFLSFTISNLVQQRWLLFCGWLLLGIADLIFLFWVNIYSQIAAGVFAVIGAGLLGFRFFQQISQQSKSKK